jgi:hypothetical protein
VDTEDFSGSRAPNPSYQFCLIGILEECDLGRGPVSLVGLKSRLIRMHEDIYRTIKEIKGARQIMWPFALPISEMFFTPTPSAATRANIFEDLL